MIAVDTNVVVRLLVGDDLKQSKAARALFENEIVWISRTVLLETAWVLDSVYGLEDRQVAASLEGLLGLAQVKVEDGEGVRLALDWAAQGMDLSDAIHLSGVPDSTRFTTFDRGLVRSAKKLGLNVVGLAF
jgi:predicted nucleic-acid-binding protein